MMEGIYALMNMVLPLDALQFNFMKNAFLAILLLTPLLGLLGSSARGEGPLPEGLARSLLVEREYLRGGMEALRQESPSAWQNAATPAR